MTVEGFLFNGILFVCLGFLFFSMIKRVVIVCADRFLGTTWREWKPAVFMAAHRRGMTVTVVAALVLLAWLCLHPTA